MKIKTNVNMIYIIAFALVYAIAVYTPLHSDDFSYALLSLDIKSHVAHYMSWSGRFIADYISNILLHINDFYLRSAINSLLIIVIIYFISALPYAATGINNTKKIFPVIFLIFWCFNPNLGQSVFWIVGSSNYSLTVLFIVSFLYLFLKWRNGLNVYKIAIISLLGFIAGWSNESASIALSFFCILMIFIQALTDREKILNTLFLCSSVFIGSALLILSPGNFNRAQDVSFQQWYSWPIFTRVLYHLEDRMIYPIITFGVVIAIAFIFSVIMALRDAKNKFLNNDTLYCASFLACSAIALLSLVGSPYTPPRSWTGGFYFSLMSLAFVINYLSQNKSILIKIIYSAFIASLVLLFIASYHLVYNSYKNISEQNKIRDAIVLKSKQESLNEITLPDYYFIKLLNVNDRFDEFFNPGAFAKYYSVDKVNIEKINFDFSPIISGSTENNKISGSRLLSLYHSKPSFFIPSTFIFAVDKNAKEFGIDDNLSLTIKFNDGSSHDLVIKYNPVSINNSLYIGVEVDSKIARKASNIYVSHGSEIIGEYSIN